MPNPGTITQALCLACETSYTVGGEDKTMGGHIYFSYNIDEKADLCQFEGCARQSWPMEWAMIGVRA
jgi:hypothetical protein